MPIQSKSLAVGFKNQYIKKKKKKTTQEIPMQSKVWESEV